MLEVSMGAVSESEERDYKLGTFVELFDSLKEGKKISKTSWEEDTFIVCQPGYPDGIPCNLNTARLMGKNEGDKIIVNPYFQMHKSDGTISVYNVSTDDLFADDWYIML